MAGTLWKGALRKPSVWFSLLVMLAFGLIAVLAPWIAPHDPYNWDLERANLPPMWVQGTAHPGTAEYLFGSDYYGRDILSRLIYGTRTAFFLALAGTLLAALIGTLVGLVAGYQGGRLDAWIMFFTEVLQALPGIMFLVMIVLILRDKITPTWFHGFLTLVIGFAAIGWVSLARVVRIQVMQIKSQLYFEAAVGIGASPRRIIFRHLLPNVLHLILVWIINTVPAVILLEAVLGYVGVALTNRTGGDEFTVVSWGGLFFSGRSAMSRNPLMLILPSLCILLISMSFVLLADYLNGITRPEE